MVDGSHARTCDGHARAHGPHPTRHAVQDAAARRDPLRPTTAARCSNERTRSTPDGMIKRAPRPLLSSGTRTGISAPSCHRCPRSRGRLRRRAGGTAPGRRSYRRSGTDPDRYERRLVVGPRRAQIERPLPVADERVIDIGPVVEAKRVTPVTAQVQLDPHDVAHLVTGEPLHRPPRGGRRSRNPGA